MPMDDGRRNERVMVATSRDIVVLPWSSRQALLGQMQRIDAARSAIDAFEAVGTSRPVMLDVDAKRVLVDSIGAWVEEVGARGIPAGVWQLRDALVDDLDDTASGPQGSSGSTTATASEMTLARLACRASQAVWWDAERAEQINA
jgi:hypothetical protein